jgi:NAD(P)-dependent dehydrogenase (short-subunit alcohol dehydrogenase family)
MSEFAGKVAIITGGGSGIGRATALLFAREGAHAVVLDWNQAAGAETVDLIEQEHGEGYSVPTDISKSIEVERAINLVLERSGRIDILFANAAVEITKPVAETSEEDWDRLYNVNMKGTFLCCKHVIPVMRKQRSGSIVIVSSGHAFVTYPNCSAYAGTKGGVLAFMRGVALDCAGDGIRVNCVVPGATDTPLLRAYLHDCADPKSEENRILSSVPLGRLAKPEDIAKAVRFLCSSDAEYITGTSLTVDGGLLAQG